MTEISFILSLWNDDSELLDANDSIHKEYDAIIFLSFYWRIAWSIKMCIYFQVSSPDKDPGDQVSSSDDINREKAAIA